MNNNRRRISELNMLSAYLDDGLDQAERDQFEERLKHEPELRERLENLRRTKLILGRLARLKAPRNFTLTPDMVTLRRVNRKPLFTFMKLAASFAAILLVLLVGFELVLGGHFGAGAQLASEAPVREMDSFPAEGTPEPLILWGSSEHGGADLQDGVNGYGSDGEIVTEKEEQEEMIEEAAPMEETFEEEQEVEEPAENMLEEPEISKAVSETEEVPILGLKPDEGGEILSRSAPEIPEQERTTQEWGVLRWVEIVLAVIALGGGIVLWLLRRK